MFAPTGHEQCVNPIVYHPGVGRLLILWPLPPWVVCGLSLLTCTPCAHLTLILSKDPNESVMNSSSKERA